MSELDQTIEELEAEVLAELEEAAHDAPTKGSAGAEPMKKVKKVGPPQSDEMQDGGDPVVEPDAADSPTDVAADKAKEVSGDEQQKDEGKPDPMKKVKKVKEDAHEDEETDEDMEMDDKSKEEILTAMYDEMKDMDKKDLMAAYVTMQKEGEHDKKDMEEQVEGYIKSIDVSSDVDALVDGEDLSEEFKKKAATIFEAAVKSKTRKELSRITEDQQVAMAIEIDEYKDTLSEKVDQYLDYVVEEWMKENELAIERGLKGEIAEDFISGLKQLFEDHYIDVPDEKYDVLEAQSEKIAELEEQLNGIMEQNIEMKTANSDLVREQVVLEAASDLTDTQFEKFKSLTEEIDFKDQDTFREKLDTLKESYFPKVSSDQTYDNDDDYGSAEQDIDTTDAMKAYMSAIGRTEKRIKGAV
jgi:hypothetical protein